MHAPLFGFSGLYDRPYGASTPIGSKPWPYSCWEVGTTGWVVAKDCRVNEKTETLPNGVKRTTYQNKNATEPYTEARPDSTSPNRWTPNAAVLTSMRSGSPTERVGLWSKYDIGARIRAVTGAMNTMTATDQKAMNDLTKEYVPDYPNAFKLTETLATTNGPAGTNAASLWYQWVTGNVATRKAVIQQIGSAVRVNRGQDPQPPSRQQVPVVQDNVDEEPPPESGVSPVLVGAGILAAVIGGYFLFRGK